MLQFVCLVVLASMLVPSHSFVLGFDSGEDPSHKFIQEVCKTACNFESRIFFDDSFPPFVCGICKIKGITPSTPSRQPTTKPTSPAVMSTTSGTTAPATMTTTSAPTRAPTTVTTTSPTTTTTTTSTTEGTTTPAP